MLKIKCFLATRSALVMMNYTSPAKLLVKLAVHIVDLYFFFLISNPIGCRLNVIHEMSDQFNRGGKNDGNRKYQSINLSQHFNKRDPKTAAKSTTGKIYTYFSCARLLITYST